MSRVVRLFDAFDCETPGMTVSELARRANLPLATTSRLVGELVVIGWLRRDGRLIQVGARMGELGARACPPVGLREAAVPYMEDIYGVVGNSVQLGVLRNGEVLCIERLSAPMACVPGRLGGRLPVHVCAAGLVLLAFAPADLQQPILAGQLSAPTRHTVTEPSRLRCLLAEIRERDYVYCAGFLTADTASVAAPVRDRNSTIVAALSVTIPNTDDARSLIPLVAASARGISRVLGHQPSHTERATATRVVD